jgi:protein TonB
VPAVVGRASVGKSAGENIVRVPKIVPRATATARVDNDAVELPTPQPIAWQSLAPPPAEVGEAAALPQEVVAQRSADIIAQAILPRPAPSLVLRNSQGATSPKLLRQILPDYPAHVRAQGVVGDVVLKVRITERGLVDDISVVAGNPALARAAVAAVGKWEFEPATLDGQPLSVETTVTFRFKR